MGLVYLGTLLYSNLLSRNMMLETAEREAYGVTMAEIGEIQRVLRSVEEGTQFLAAVIEVLEPNEDELRRSLRAFAGGDERIYGSATAFEPYGFDLSTERFSPYYYVAPNGRLASADLASDAYRYWEQDKVRTGRRVGHAPMVGAPHRRGRWRGVDGHLLDALLSQHGRGS